MNKKVILAILPIILMTTTVMATGNCLKIMSITENGGCPPCTTKQYVETVIVNPDGSTVLSSSLDNGFVYLLKASGTYTYWPAQLPNAGIADAQCSLRPQGSYNPGPGPQWINGNVLPSPYTNYLEILLDGSAITWETSCNTIDHIYTHSLTGTGSKIGFNILDSYYGDNSGSLQVDVYKCEDPCLRDSDNDGMHDCTDMCPGTVPDTMTLGTNRWMWNGNAWITKPPKGRGPQKYFNVVGDTYGCSCTQILDWLHSNYPAQFGNMEGHYKFGCSISIMEDFLRLSNE